MSVAAAVTSVGLRRRCTARPRNPPHTPASWSVSPSAFQAGGTELAARADGLGRNGRDRDGSGLALQRQLLHRDERLAVEVDVVA
ncbi:MAG: hypothetical protein ACRDTT_04680, partial [Pseudonocardiaceae bacterium]